MRTRLILLAFIVLMWPGIVCIPMLLPHIEKLENPKQVVEVTDNALVLDSGDRVVLPCIETLPSDHPVFLEALQDGVEVRHSGEVVGLLKYDRTCGYDPIYSKLRVDLSTLAAVLAPSGIDATVVHSNAIEQLKEHHAHVTGPIRINAYFLADLRQVRRQFDFSLHSQL